MKLKLISLALISILLLMGGCTAVDPYPDDAYFTQIWVTDNTSIHTMDGSTFGGGGGGGVTSVTGTLPVMSTGGVTPDISLNPGDVANWNFAYGGTVVTWNGPLYFTAGGTAYITAANTTQSGYLTSADWNTFNSCNSSQWISEAFGIRYDAGNIGIGTPSIATSLVNIYSNNGATEGSPTLKVEDNSSGTNAIYASIMGAKTDNAFGVRIENFATSGTANKNKYGLYISNGAVWNGVGATNYGLFIDTPTGGTTNVGAYISGNSIISGNLSITASAIDMSQIGIEPSSTPNRVGIYAWDLSADNSTIGFFTETAVELGIAIASTNKIPIRWNGHTYNLLVEGSGWRTPLVNTVRPTVEQGLQVGMILYNLTSNIWEKCTSISPVTWESLSGGTEYDPVFGASVASSIQSANITNWNNKLSSITGTGLDNVFSSNGLLKRTGVATYTLDASVYLTANQNITLSSDASGSGTTSIAVTNTGLKGVALPTLATGYLYYNGSAWVFQTPAGGTHNLLDGSTHPDTTAGTVARGDIITGQGSTPKWTKLVKGAANQVLAMDGTGTDILWVTPTGAPDSRLIVDAVNGGEQHDVTASVALTNVAVIDIPLTAGTYTFKYNVIYRSNQLTNGIRLAVNYTGTNGAFVWSWRGNDLGNLASAAAADQDSVLATGAIIYSFASRAKSTTTRGVTASVDTANADMFAIIEGVFIATGSGDLELWHGSELATALYTTSVMPGTSVIVTKTK